MKKILMKGVYIIHQNIHTIIIYSLDTRETAFVHAVTAAGIAYTIAKACSMGELVECSCDKNLVRHNVLNNMPGGSNNNQMTAAAAFETTRSNKNRNKMPRRNGKKRITNKRKAPMMPDMPAMGETWEWSGCDDNVNFGNRKSKDFLDSRFRRRSDIRTLVKIQNNDAGRLVSHFEFVNRTFSGDLRGEINQK
jgi:wingless-type MMTV integration site family, member 6